jgi:hypothetical protein
MCQKEAVSGVTRSGGLAAYASLGTEAVVKVPTDVDPPEYTPIIKKISFQVQKC